MNLCSNTLAASFLFILTAACSADKPAPKASLPAATTGLVCSYAPSQSDIVSHVAAVAGGGAAAAAAFAKAAGLTAVLHSSGAYIFTGSAGYIAGTIGTAVTGPILIGIGVVIGGTAATVELVCAPSNHPAAVAKVEHAASDFYKRVKASIVAFPISVAPFTAKTQTSLIRAGNEVFDYANRKTVALSAAFSK